VIDREPLARYLAGVFRSRVEILALQPLKGGIDGGLDPKGFGYGVPFEVGCVIDGTPRSFVVSRTRPAKRFARAILDGGPFDLAMLPSMFRGGLMSKPMSWAIWITGLPGSGKSVLARGAAAELEALGKRVVVLELDEIRKFLTPAPTYSETERDLVYRALVSMARALVLAGVSVIVDATAHRRVWRDLACASIERFAEVQLECPIEVCRERERDRREGNAPRGIYAQAGRLGAAVPGVDVPYEPTLAPELAIDTAAKDVSTAIRRIVGLALALAHDGIEDRPDPSARWAIWITGLPGSGKTTIARSVADALAARGVPVKVLELAEMRRPLLGEQPESDYALEIVHRALAYTAKLLTEAGVAVIVDATAPRRAWRELARDLIARFAEVQLRCPREICLERERAVRWHLAEHATAPHAAHAIAEAPDLVFGYEHSLRPELTLYTDVQGLCSAVEEVLRLANCLFVDSS